MKRASYLLSWLLFALLLVCIAFGSERYEPFVRRHYDTIQPTDSMQAEYWKHKADSLNKTR